MFKGRKMRKEILSTKRICSPGVAFVIVTPMRHFHLWKC